MNSCKSDSTNKIYSCTDHSQSIQMADHFDFKNTTVTNVDQSGKHHEWRKERRKPNFNPSKADFDEDSYTSSSSKMMTHGSTSRWCFLKLLQIVLVGLLIYASSCFFFFRESVKSSKFPRQDIESFHSNARKPLLFNENSNDVYFKNIDGNSKPRWAKVVHAPVRFCSTSPKMVIIVHSRPENEHQRNLIRQTWGGVETLADGSSVRILFVLGNSNYPVGEDKLVNNRQNVEGVSHIGWEYPIPHLLEATSKNDILIGDFQDTYQNLSLKHQLGVRWVVQNCPQTSLLLKADDDAFIDLHSLTRFLNRTLGTTNPRNMIACDVIPEGTSPRRTGKWRVSYSEYPLEKYPRYCSGLAYVMSMDVGRKLLQKVETSKWLWVDDVWMTGILAENLKLSYILLNARYCYDEIIVREWMNEALDNAPPPCMVIHLDSYDPQYATILKTLWRHSVFSK